MIRQMKYLFLLLLVLSSRLCADDWTVGVGGNPARNSLSSAFGPTWANLVWGEGLSAVIAQQAVIEGEVVVMARIQDLNDVLYGTIIVAHDLQTGDTLWTAGLPVEFPDTDWRNRVSGIRGGNVYVTRAGNTNASYLYALDAATGGMLWQSEDLVTETSTEGVTFAPDGDPITTGVSSVIRIDSTDGSTVWESTRSCPTSGGCDPVVYGDRVYLWEAGVDGPVITAFDLTTGNELFSSEGIGGGFIQQVAPLVGPDGTIYGPRTQNNPVTDFFVALKDTGAGFAELWRVPMGYVPFASHGVGPDGSVYMYSRSNRVLRLDPVDGEIVDSSEVIKSDFYQPRMAVDSKGMVFVTNGGFSEGAVFAFSPDLETIWSEPITNVNVGGPALGEDGYMIVCGVGTDVRAYRTEPPVSVAGNQTHPETPNLEQNYPNPFNPTTEIGFRITTGGEITLTVFDLLGKQVTTLVDDNLMPGSYTARWNAAGHPTGTYFYRISTEHGVVTRKMMLMR